MTPLLLGVLSNRTEIDGSKTTREAVDLSFKEPKQFSLTILSRDRHFDHVAGIERPGW